MSGEPVPGASIMRVPMAEKNTEFTGRARALPRCSSGRTRSAGPDLRADRGHRTAGDYDLRVLLSQDVSRFSRVPA